MGRFVSLLLCSTAALAIRFKEDPYAPVTFKNKDTPPACQAIKCAPLSCQPPFTWTNAQDSGTCCPVCFSDSVVVPKEPSYGATSGVGPAPGSPANCNSAYCPQLMCDVKEYHDGDCCETCAVDSTFSEGNVES